MSPLGLHLAGIGLVVCGVRVDVGPATEGVLYWLGSQGNTSAVVSYTEGLREGWLIHVREWRHGREVACYRSEGATLREAHDRVSMDIDLRGGRAAVAP